MKMALLLVFRVIIVALTFGTACASCPSECRCPSSTTVRCENANMTSVPGDIPASTSKLFLAGGNLADMPEDFGSALPNLAWLHMDSNKLTKLKIDGANFPSLTIIGFGFNNIQDAGWQLTGVFKELLQLGIDHLPVSEDSIGLEKLAVTMPKLQQIYASQVKVRELRIGRGPEGLTTISMPGIPATRLIVEPLKSGKGCMKKLKQINIGQGVKIPCDYNTSVAVSRLRNVEEIIGDCPNNPRQTYRKYGEVWEQKCGITGDADVYCPLDCEDQNQDCASKSDKCFAEWPATRSLETCYLTCSACNQTTKRDWPNESSIDKMCNRTTPVTTPSTPVTTPSESTALPVSLLALLLPAVLILLL